MKFTTAELYDEYGESLQVAVSLFKNYGGKKSFYGPVSTIKVHEDNKLVRDVLEDQGEGKVLVIDGGESLRCALVGDKLAQLGKDNGWEGIIVSGCIRDSAVISSIDIGVMALNTNPRKSEKKGTGFKNIPVSFAGVGFAPGDYVYADEDGIVVSHVEIV